MKKNTSKSVLLVAMIMLSITTNYVLAQTKKTVPTEKYKSVKIGNQVWMSENLNVSTFRNGDPIPEFEKNKNVVNDVLPYWCYYDFNITNGNIYGKLYNWSAVNDKRGLAPKGWHIPSYEEWKELADFLGFSENSKTSGVALNKLKSTSGWEGYYNGNGTNETGFNALPGAGGNPWYEKLPFNNQLHETGIWWCSQKINDHEYCARIDGKYNISIPFLGDNSHNAISVRCIKDGSTLSVKPSNTKSSSNVPQIRLTAVKKTGIDGYTDAERAEIKKKQQDKDRREAEEHKKNQQANNAENAQKANVPKVKATVKGKNEPANTIAK
jgi:uncharacterized protein (TIGR02145 family)